MSHRGTENHHAGKLHCCLDSHKTNRRDLTHRRELGKIEEAISGHELVAPKSFQ